MYFKLALKNVKKSFKDFLIYFLTLAFSVCLFYTFNSFQAQQAVLDMNESQESIVQTTAVLMLMVSIFVVIVLAFLILYANNFLIKRRKKELGMYMLLGMPKRKISRVLVYETFIIGASSLLVGMICGILLSQVLTAVSAGLFEVPLDYHFVFSPLATLITILAFGGIFFITMLFNTLVLNRYKLIDLINAEHKNAELKIKKVWISVILFLISVVLLGGDYFYAIKQGANALFDIVPICIVGFLGTVLFFLSLAGFLLTVIKTSKRIYFKSLNCFILRQINTNINANFISMSVVCIMLLLSIGALSTGLSLNRTINTVVQNSTPYDYTYCGQYYNTFNGGEKLNWSPENSEELIRNLAIDKSRIQSENYETIYKADLLLSDPDIVNNVDSSYRSLLSLIDQNIMIKVIPLSVYNHELKIRNYKPIQLENNETYLESSAGQFNDVFHSLLNNEPTLTLYGKDLKVTNKDYNGIPIGTTYGLNDIPIALIVNDSIIPANAEVMSYYWNVNLNKNMSDVAFSDMVQKAIGKVNETLPDGVYLQSIAASSTKSDVYTSSKGLSVMFTYIGIYLGIVFMIASAVILALQQLSQASENKKRYTVLSKIGCEPKMMNRSIFTQIAIYFLLPLALAIVHSIIGINVVNQLVITFGKTDIFLSSLITGGVILCIYGVYFLVTYLGYKNIIKSQK